MKAIRIVLLSAAFAVGGLLVGCTPRLDTFFVNFSGEPVVILEPLSKEQLGSRAQRADKLVPNLETAKANGYIGFESKDVLIAKIRFKEGVLVYRMKNNASIGTKTGEIYLRIFPSRKAYFFETKAGAASANESTPQPADWPITPTET